MQNTGINPLVIDEIRAAAKRSNLTKVILFGSRARGDYKKQATLTLP